MERTVEDEIERISTTYDENIERTIRHLLKNNVAIRNTTVINLNIRI